MDQRAFDKQLAAATSPEAKISLLDARAEELFERERYNEALKFYEQALALETGSNPRAYFTGQIGICQYNLGDDRKALKSLSRSAGLFQPDEPEFMPDMCGYVHFHLGSILEYQGKVVQS